MSLVLLHDLLALPKPDLARPAIVDGDRSWSYADLRREVEALASAIAAAGAGRGDRVAILLPKSLPECAALFAASRADAVVVPINPQLRAQQVRHILVDSGARVLVTSGAQLDRLGDTLADLPGLAHALCEGRDVLGLGGGHHQHHDLRPGLGLEGRELGLQGVALRIGWRAHIE
jgi:acyl-coenzyme A synthetase/AMP-(fatty) acid ligase